MEFIILYTEEQVKELLKQQREICFNNWSDNKTIVNAKEPLFPTPHEQSINYKSLKTYDEPAKIGSDAKWSKIQDKIDAAFNGEAADFYWLQLEKQKIVEDKQIEKVTKFIKNLSDYDFDVIWIPKFLKWEKDFEEKLYQKGIQGESILFSIITKIAEKEGNSINGLDEDFLSTAFKWEGLTFKLYNGQGSFWRISKSDKVLFQSS